MVSMTLALLTVLPARRALLAGAAALLAAPVAKAAPVTTAASILALPAPVAVADPILSAIRAHRRAWAAFQIGYDKAGGRLLHFSRRWLACHAEAAELLG